MRCVPIIINVCSVGFGRMSQDTSSQCSSRSRMSSSVRHAASVSSNRRKKKSSTAGSETGELYGSSKCKVHHKRAYSKGSSKSSRHHLNKKGKDTADDMANVMADHVFNRGMDQKHKQEQRDEQSTSMNIHNNESESSLVK